MKKNVYLTAAILICIGCSPLKSSPNDEKHQLELTLQEIKTNIDDVRHDMHRFQTEMQILDGRIKYYEHALAGIKQEDLERQQTRIDELAQQVQAFEKKYGSIQESRQIKTNDLVQLSAHAQETQEALIQFKARLVELEQSIQAQNRRFDEISKLKNHFENLARQLSTAEKKNYIVKPGDTLEKIARLNQTTSERLKKTNDLKNDRLVVGQELVLPDDAIVR